MLLSLAVAVAVVGVSGAQFAHICDIPGICRAGYTCVRESASSGKCVKDRLCQEDSCGANEECVEYEYHFKCVCAPGSRSHGGACVEFCDLPDACADPAMTCSAGSDSWDCTCPEDTVLAGGLCRAPCSTELCPGGLECLVENSTTVSCLCEEGAVLDGEDCGGACSQDSCPRGMSCETAQDHFSCRCPKGWLLEEEVCRPECEVTPCAQGQSCVAHLENYMCCPTGHLPHPDTLLCVPACSIPKICGPGLECLVENEGADYTCLCPEHMAISEEGGCVELCELDVCFEGMECSSFTGGFNCSCSEESCSTCSDGPCGEGMVCVQGDYAHQCLCDQGYRLLHGACQDVDECQEEGVCRFGGAECTNTPGGYECRCPGYSYYNDTTNSCSPYNMCLADVCETSSSGLSCQSLERGFACLCPEGYPAELCEVQDPCQCGEQEECVGQGAQWGCQCDQYSVLDISSLKCVPDVEIRDAGTISPSPKKGVEFNFRLGERGSVAIKLRSNSGNKGRAPWQMVGWYKADRSMVITEGAVPTPPGHFRTPNHRQFLNVQHVRPADAGEYLVKVFREGYRPVTELVQVHIKPALRALSGPKDKGTDRWKMQVSVNAKLQDYQLVWYRDGKGGRERLVDDGEDVKIEDAGRQLTTKKVPGVYVAVLRGRLAGPDQLYITGTAEFDAMFA